MRALVTGITGQIGSYLVDFLLTKDYEVHGIVRRSSQLNPSRIAHIHDRLTLHTADLSDQGSLQRVLEEIDPDECYNLAAQSFVPASHTAPVHTADITGLGCLRMLEAIRHTNPVIRFLQASSSEMFGKVQEEPQRETTRFYPRSPYGVAKLFAHWSVVNHREAYGLHASAAIMMNNESPRRGEEFVTRKITLGLARVRAGLQDHVTLGNLDARRDWGFSGDYVRALWKMLQQDEPDDYVIATGETHTVREFAQAACTLFQLDFDRVIKIDPAFLRPSEVVTLCGDATKARERLGWQPTTTFQALVEMMCDSDWAKALQEKRKAAG